MIKGLYIHIPFCIKKCTFCDFSVYALGKNYLNTSDLNISNYVNALNKEILFKKSLSNSITSIYFGGGTPTLLDTPIVSDILKNIKEHYNIMDDCEISIESDPGTFDKSKLDDLFNLGFNRLTMGIQSLDKNVQPNLNRSHTLDIVFKSIDIISSSKLITGLPNQSNESSIDDIEYLSDKCNHLSIYSLSLEPKSSLYTKYVKEYNSKLYQFNQAKLFETIHYTMNNKGFEHYEISSFCKKGYNSKHNTTYWKFDDYLGFGLSSTSKIDKQIFKNPTSFKKYYEYIKNISDANYINKVVEENMDCLLYLKYSLMNLFRLNKPIDLALLKQNMKLRFTSSNDSYTIEDLINKILIFFKTQELLNISIINDIIYINSIEFMMLSDEFLLDLFVYLENSNN